jgi:hypothetical protein
MTTNVWRINWRDSKTGNIVETAGVDYPSWDHADAALSTLLGFRKTLTATIDRYVVEIPMPTPAEQFRLQREADMGESVRERLS